MEAVIHAMGKTATLLLFGSVGAKAALRKWLLTSYSAMPIVWAEPADKMTENPISAKLRAYFHFAADRR